MRSIFKKIIFEQAIVRYSTFLGTALFLFAIQMGFITPNAHANDGVGKSCQAQQISLQVLGSGGPELPDGRASSSYLISQSGQAAILLDAGSGSSLRFEESKADITTLKAILFSHLHTDHANDLATYIKASFFSEREANLKIFGPTGNRFLPDTTVFVQRLLSQDGVYPYLHDYLIEGKEAYLIEAFNSDRMRAKFEFDGWRISSISVPHGPIKALAWKVQRGQCTIVYSGDTSDAENQLAKFAADADLLIAHNAVSDQAGTIAKRLHMTPTQIATIAKQSGVKMVLLSHFMQRSETQKSKLKQTIELSGGPTTYLAEDLMMIEFND